MKRKIIQIVPLQEYGYLAALCDDGSVWQMSVPGYWLPVDTSRINNYVQAPPTVQP